jgi:hypothetical protein
MRPSDTKRTCERSSEDSGSTKLFTRGLGDAVVLHMGRNNAATPLEVSQCVEREA